METLVAYTNLSGMEAPQFCPVLGLAGRMMQLKLPEPADIGIAIKIEADDTMSLGEVNCCRPDGEGYVVCVELSQSLHDVNEHVRLARALLA